MRHRKYEGGLSDIFLTMALIQVLFIVLKLTSVGNWTWFQTFMPVILTISMFVFLMVGLILFVIFRQLVRDLYRKLKKKWKN